MIASVTDARQEVSQKNGGVRGETAKTQSKEIDETAARDHGGTSGPTETLDRRSFLSKPAILRSIPLLAAVSAGISSELTLRFAKAT